MVAVGAFFTGGVVDDEDFYCGMCLPGDAFEGFVEEIGLFVGGDDDCDERRKGFGERGFRDVRG